MNKLIAILGLLSISSSGFGQSVAKTGHECSFDIAVPAISCINPDVGTDIRLLIMEFQTCQAGRITALDRSISALHVIKSGENIHDLRGEDVKVELSSVRTHIDDRADDTTIVLPKSAAITDGATRFDLNISTKREANYDGAPSDEWHYVGSFKKLNSAGKTVESGKIICNIVR